MSESTTEFSPDGKHSTRVSITGSLANIETIQDTQVEATVKEYNTAVGANEMGVYVELGSIRVRTDGLPATAITGVPMGEGFYEFWRATSISIYYNEYATVTVVSR